MTEPEPGRTIDDSEPFLEDTSRESKRMATMGGAYALVAYQADVMRRLSLKIAAWARAHDFWVADDELSATSKDGCTVAAALREITEHTAVLRGTAYAPVAITFSAETIAASWMRSLRLRFGSRPPTTGDARFDACFDVRTSNVAAMRRILDSNARRQLLAMDGACFVTYTNGHIELRLETRRLAGAHLLSAIEVVATIVRAGAPTPA